MSTLRLATLIGAISTTLLLVLAYVLEATAHKNLIPDPITALWRIATVITWLSFVAAYCRDSLITHIDRTAAQTTDRALATVLAAVADSVNKVVPNTNRALDVVLRAIQDAVEEAGDRGATEARLDTIAKYGPTPPVDPVRPGRFSIVDG